MSTIHLRIYDLRKANQMSQKELADEVGVSVQTVSKWENNVCMPDITLSQCVMRHVNEPGEFLQKMIAQTKPGGLVIAIDVNRELESDGLYIDGLEYSELCSRTGFRKMWEKEKECQGRDYAIGMRLPFMMREEEMVRGFVNHGMDRKEAEHYCRRQRKIQAFMTANREDLKYLHYLGLMISYGWKKT